MLARHCVGRSSKVPRDPSPLRGTGGHVPERQLQGDMTNTLNRMIALIGEEQQL